MNVVAFAVTDAEGPDLNAEFYGFPARLVTLGSVATVVIESDEPPAAVDETLLAYHEFVDAVAKQRACLPHRFGLVVERDRVLKDLADNRQVFERGLEAVRGRREWLLRARVKPGEAATVVAQEAGLRPSSDDMLETGRVVHGLVADRLLRDAQDVMTSLVEFDIVGYERLHDDRLGFDLEIVDKVSNGDFTDQIETLCGERGAYSTFELFGPTACYRFSDRVMSALAT